MAAADTKSAAYYADGIKRGDVAILSQAITLGESTRPEHQALAREVLRVTGSSGENTFRLGITGVPGVGKSTFIEAYGKRVLKAGHKLAVLAVDPSSIKHRGSILGDKTRMQTLSASENVYIRPSPSGGTLGGVARSTYSTIMLCEAAGYDYVIVETVGVGQSEVAVNRLTDFFLLLMLAGAGDELQGIKRGIMEMADAVVITKADSGNEKKAQSARTEFAQAIHLLQPPESGWRPQVMTCSALEDKGIDEIFRTISKYKPQATQGGYFARNRRSQQLELLKDTLREELLQRFYSKPQVYSRLKELEDTGMEFDPFEEVARLLKEADA